jgi:hypothetical protein
MRAFLLVSILVLFEPFSQAAGDSCVTYPVKVGSGRLDLAPPGGFVEICSQDAKLCSTLTRGFPPSVQTVGYFVSPQEWAQFKKGEILGFTRYLIAQISRSTAAQGFPGLKDFVRSQQGTIPDHTDLPSTLKSQGRVGLGVIEETSDSITFGTIMKTQVASSPDKEFVLVALNAAMVVGPLVLSLYSFRDYQTMGDVETAKQLTKSWLQCIRSSNRKGGLTSR